MSSRGPKPSLTADPREGISRGHLALTYRFNGVESHQAEVAELADALRSGRSGHYACVGSNPTFGMRRPPPRGFSFLAPRGHACRLADAQVRYARMNASPETKPPVSRLWLVLVIAAGILVLGDLNQRMADARQLEQDVGLLQTEVASLEAENGRLQTRVAEATSEAAVERWARSEGKMVRPGEVLVFPIAPTGMRLSPLPTPTPEPSLPSNWEVWWALFFGG